MTIKPSATRASLTEHLRGPGGKRQITGCRQLSAYQRRDFEPKTLASSQTQKIHYSGWFSLFNTLDVLTN